jgi:hypothetical protein
MPIINGRHTIVVVAAIVAVTAALVLLPLIGFAQESERVVERVPWRTEPIKILKLKTKNNEVEAGKKFSEADDWLVGLTVTVQNTSNKPIARSRVLVPKSFHQRPKAFPGEEPFGGGNASHSSMRITQRRGLTQSGQLPDKPTPQAEGDNIFNVCNFHSIQPAGLSRCTGDNHHAIYS